MSKTGRTNPRRADRERKFRQRAERQIYLRTVPKDPPDVQLLSKAFLALALEDAKKTAASKQSTQTSNREHREGSHDDE